jgi:3-phosphoshikimate 1-carboxyvinyltransferase
LRAVIRGQATVTGEVRLPGDKSLAHRALILGALADGELRVRGLPSGGDIVSTRRCLETLGAVFEPLTGGGLRVIPPDPWRPDQTLDCGNSGTTARLLTGVLAGLGLPCTLVGDASLSRRPMRRVAEPLRRLGAAVATGEDGCLPLRIAPPRGRLEGARLELPVASAQVKSAALLAGLRGHGPTTVVEPARSRDHTERLLSAMGVPVTREGLAATVPGLDAAGRPPRLRGLSLDLPGDISTAAFFLAAGAMLPGASVVLRGVGVNPTRTGVLDALHAMGAAIKLANERDAGGEPVADLALAASPLRAVEVAGELVPRLIDELPILAVAATAAAGTTVVRDAAELRHKESDRIATTVTQLTRLGAKIEEHPDGFTVHGPAALRGAPVDAGGDHRLAMALAVAALAATGETVIAGAEAAAVSHPGFWEDLGRLAGPGVVRLQEEGS